MRCPKCGLENPQSALRCDCGYDFASGQMKPSYVAARPNVGRVRLIRFIGVMFIVGAVLISLVTAFVEFISSIGAFGTHQGPSQKPLPLLFYLDIAEASIVTVVLIVVGVGLIRLKPGARIGAILVGAFGLYFSFACFIMLYGTSLLPGPPFWMCVVAAVFPPITLIFASLAFLLIVVLHTRSARAAFVSGRRKETAN